MAAACASAARLCGVGDAAVVGPSVLQRGNVDTVELSQLVLIQTFLQHRTANLQPSVVDHALLFTLRRHAATTQSQAFHAL